MLDFPKENLQRIKAARFDCMLMPRTGSGIRIEYNLSIDLEAFVLHEEDGPCERSIKLSNMPLNAARDWRQVSGIYHYGKDEIQGAIRTRNQWLPVDLPFIEIRHLSGVRFAVDCQLYFDMEVWDDCYRNFEAFLGFEASFTGYKNQTQILGREHDLSTPEKIRAFVGQYLDLQAYRDFNVRDVFITMKPEVG